MCILRNISQWLNIDCIFLIAKPVYINSLGVSIIYLIIDIKRNKTKKKEIGVIWPSEECCNNNHGKQGMCKKLVQP